MNQAALDVGVIYVHAEGALEEAIHAAIAAYWRARGALPMRDQRDIERLAPDDLQARGQLGLAVAPPSEARGGFIICDSERYSADEGLAAHLHEILGVETCCVMRSGTIKRGRVTHYVGGEARRVEGPKRAARAAEGIPTLSFDEARREGAPLLGFQRIFRAPGSPEGPYRGPDPDAAQPRNRDLRLMEGRALLHPDHEEALVGWLQRYPSKAMYVLSGLKGIDVFEPRISEMAVRLAPAILGLPKPNHHDALQARKGLARAAFCAGDLPCFEEALSGLKPRAQAFFLEGFAAEVAEAGRLEGAVALLERAMARDEISPASWNNLCWALAQQPDLERRDPAWIEARIEGALAQAPGNPHIFHNLACLALRLGREGLALDCVEGALERGYPLLERLEEDSDLEALRAHPRWVAAWGAHHAALAAEAEAEAQPVAEADKPLKVIHPWGLEIEGVGALRAEATSDAHFAVVGEPPDDIDASMGTYRFFHYDLTLIEGGPLINHRADHTRTRLLEVDPFALEGEALIEHLTRKADRGEIHVSEGGRRVIFEALSLELSRRYTPKDVERLLRGEEIDRKVEEWEEIGPDTLEASRFFSAISVHTPRSARERIAEEKRRARDKAKWARQDAEKARALRARITRRFY